MRTRQSLRRTPRLTPIRHCSRWGLPCRFRCRNRGGLLPHRFTLAFNAEGGLFSAALSLGSPRPGVTRHRRLVESGLSSQNDACAAIRPSALLRSNSDALKNQTTSAIRLRSIFFGQAAATRQVSQSKRSARRLFLMQHLMASRALALTSAPDSSTQNHGTHPTRLERCRENGCRSARSVIASTSTRSSFSPTAQGRNLSLNAASTSSNRIGHLDSSGIG